MLTCIKSPADHDAMGNIPIISKELACTVPDWTARKFTPEAINIGERSANLREKVFMLTATLLG